MYTIIQAIMLIFWVQLGFIILYTSYKYNRVLVAILTLIYLFILTLIGLGFYADYRENKEYGPEEDDEEY